MTLHLKIETEIEIIALVVRFFSNIPDYVTKRDLKVTSPSDVFVSFILLQPLGKKLSFYN